MTVAVSEARLTFTSTTPGTAASALSTRPTQEAQDIAAIVSSALAFRAG